MSGTLCYFSGCKWAPVGRCNYRIDHFGTECGNRMCSSHIKDATYLDGVRAVAQNKPAHCLQHEPPHNQARML